MACILVWQMAEQLVAGGLPHVAILDGGVESLLKLGALVVPSPGAK